MTGLPRGREHLVRADLDGFEPDEARVVSARTSSLELRLGLGGALWGHVRDSGMNALAEFSIWVAPQVDESFESLGEFLVRSARRGPLRAQGPFRFERALDGYFEIGGLVPGSVTLFVQAPDGRRFYWPPAGEDRGIAVFAGARTGPVEVVAPECFDLRVRVADGVRGQALPGVRVRPGAVGHEPSDDPQQGWTTDEAGIVELRCVAESTELTFEVDGYAPERATVALLRSAERLRGAAVVTLRPSTRLRVRVLDELGAGFADQRIVAHLSRKLWRGRTDEAGEALLHGLPLLSQVTVIWSGDDGQFLFRRVRLESEFENLLELRRWDRARGAGVFGEVRWRDQPTGAAFVEFRQGRGELVSVASVEPDGSYRVGPLEAGPGELRVRVGAAVIDNDHELSYPLEIGRDALELDIDLPPGEALGQVLATTDGGLLAPARDALVSVERIPRSFEDGGVRYSMAARVRTDEEGRFRAFGLEDGLYSVTVRIAGYADGRAEVWVEKGASANVAPLILTRERL